MNKVQVNNFIFTDAKIANNGKIKNGNLSFRHALVGEELSADTMTFTISNKDGLNEQDFPYGSPVYYYTSDSTTFEDSAFECTDGFFECTDGLFVVSDEVPVWNVYVKHYLTKFRHLSGSNYQIETTSAIGILTKSKHYGGMYVNAPVTSVLSDILSTVNYSLDPVLQNSLITGYLPIATRRDNLQQVLFAIYGAIKITANGELQISTLSDVATGTISKERCYTGGSITTGEIIDGVSLTEHNYFESEEEKTLYNKGIVGTEPIEFDEPYHSLVCTGGTIVESGANYAKIRANAMVTLVGKRYEHVTRIVSVGNAGGSNVQSITNAYLANVQNSQDLAERVFDYLKCNQKIAENVLVGNERVGDVVNIYNQKTGQTVKAILKSMQTNTSRKNKASVEAVVGFEPQGIVTGYTHAVLLTSGSSFVIPNAGNVRMILVGGGGGGDGGNDGKAGTNGEWSDGSNGGSVVQGIGGSGGAAGKGGAGGRIFEYSFNVTANTTVNYSIGAGGLGGARNGGKGTDGTPTTLTANGTQYSSANGRAYKYGYHLDITVGGTRLDYMLGQSGIDGLAGGKGGNGTKGVGGWSWSSQEKAEDGGSVGLYTGGIGALAYTREPEERHYYEYGGGGGGGAAVGSNGGNANHQTGGTGANAANGANGVGYGQGGGAGNGGGGGGGGAPWEYDLALGGSWGKTTYSSGGGGTAGTGGVGGNGNQGCIILFY